jgi:hypothetical protein
MELAHPLADLAQGFGCQKLTQENVTQKVNPPRGSWEG